MKKTKYKEVHRTQASDLVYRSERCSTEDLVLKAIDELLTNDEVEIISISYTRTGSAVIYYRE